MEIACWRRKTRSAVIVSNDAANRNLGRIVVVPLTSNASRQYSGGWRTARQRMGIMLSTSGG
jgi:mRNA-degrading endonuclease toxin of MazEF toxin-antitoxin module